MKQIISGIKYWGQLLLLPIYWLSFLFPRDKHIWLFGSTFGRRFADNPRYFYLYVSQHSDRSSEQVRKSVQEWKEAGHAWEEDENCRGIRPIWISHNKDIVEFLQGKGYEAYYYHSLKGIWYALRGKIYFFDNYSKDINFWLSGGAVKINLWHGVGNKKINYDNEHDKVRHPKNLWEQFKYFPRRLSDEKPSHYILSTSPMMSEIFARAFQVPEEHVIEAGYPRNDILFVDCLIQNLYLSEEQKLQEQIAVWKAEGKTILVYAPTFRESEKRFLEIVNLDKFAGFLYQHNMILLCKLHPKSFCKEVFAKMRYSCIINVSSDVDINSFLGQTDLMIADYSSVYSDYMLLDKPVVAFHYDYTEYSSDTRAAYFDWNEYMPEQRAYLREELEEAILALLMEDKNREKRVVFREKLYKNIDGCSALRLASEVMAKL